MTQAYETILNAPAVRTALALAWKDSRPGGHGAHEEGGFVLRDAAGELTVLRWSGGLQNSIFLPAHPACRIDEKDIAASFHTHPNTGADYLQEPGETDRRAVCDDPHLKGQFYVGEFVISRSQVYLIAPNGQVSEVGNAAVLLE